MVTGRQHCRLSICENWLSWTNTEYQYQYHNKRSQKPFWYSNGDPVYKNLAHSFLFITIIHIFSYDHFCHYSLNVTVIGTKHTGQLLKTSRQQPGFLSPFASTRAHPRTGESQFYRVSQKKSTINNNNRVMIMKINIIVFSCVRFISTHWMLYGLHCGSQVHYEKQQGGQDQGGGWHDP